MAPKPSAERARLWYFGTWQGSYRVKRHEVKRPSVQIAWIRDRGDEFSGEGTLVFDSDESGQVRGTGAGALGAQTIVGAFDGDVLTLGLEGDPALDQAFNGTARCTRSADQQTLECEMNASSNDGDLVRSGTASAARIVRNR